MAIGCRFPRCRVVCPFDQASFSLRVCTARFRATVRPPTKNMQKSKEEGSGTKRFAYTQTQVAHHSGQGIQLHRPMAKTLALTRRRQLDWRCLAHVFVGLSPAMLSVT